MTKSGCCTSRRSFLSRVAGGFLAAGLPKRVFPGDDMPALNSVYRGQRLAKTHLKWDVFVTPSIPLVTTDFTPGEHQPPWPPTSSTLIYGSLHAVLRDSSITPDQSPAPPASIASPRKNPP